MQGAKSLPEEADLPKSLNLVSDTCSNGICDDLSGAVPYSSRFDSSGQIEFTDAPKGIPERRC